MRIKRCLRVGSTSLPDGFTELLLWTSRTDFILKLTALRHREIAEPVRLYLSLCIHCI